MHTPSLLAALGHTPSSARGASPLVFAWALVGNFALLADASVRMLDAADHHARRAHAGPFEWLAAAAIALAFAYGEGHLALERRFIPDLVARAATIRGRVPSLLAPLVAAGLCCVPRAQLVRSWTLVLGIVAMVIAMRLLSPALHAGVDLGVALAMMVGTLALVRQGVGHVALRSDARTSG
jgi:hypothetical protein